MSRLLLSNKSHEANPRGIKNDDIDINNYGSNMDNFNLTASEMKKSNIRKGEEITDSRGKSPIRNVWDRSYKGKTFNFGVYKDMYISSTCISDYRYTYIDILIFNLISREKCGGFDPHGFTGNCPWS
jgi:hypothetical protein